MFVPLPLALVTIPLPDVTEALVNVIELKKLTTSW
jgi:hypothetical protein